MRKALHWSAFFVVWLLCSPSALADRCSIPSGAQSVVVRAVIDGDTLELNDGRRVRLIGIDTPEIGRRGQASEPFAEEARERLRVLAGRQVRLVEGEEPRDRHGRTLAHLFAADGHNIEATLLSEGLGFALAVPPNTAMIDCHARAERKARTAGRGLWQTSPIVPATEVRGGFQLVRGRITEVTRADRYVWLDTDGSLVLRMERATFPELGLGSPEGLRGRRVVARGWVIDRRSRGSVKAGFKPFMLPIAHPLMIELD